MKDIMGDLERELMEKEQEPTLLPARAFKVLRRPVTAMPGDPSTETMTVVAHYVEIDGNGIAKFYTGKVVGAPGHRVAVPMVVRVIPDYLDIEEDLSYHEASAKVPLPTLASSKIN